MNLRMLNQLRPKERVSFQAYRESELLLPWKLHMAAWRVSMFNDDGFELTCFFCFIKVVVREVSSRKQVWRFGQVLE